MVDKRLVNEGGCQFLMRRKERQERMSFEEALKEQKGEGSNSDKNQLSKTSRSTSEVRDHLVERNQINSSTKTVC